MIEVIAIVSSIIALIVSAAALYLDQAILRELHPHHQMVRELHHHLGPHRIVNDVGHDTGLHVDEHAECRDCGPVYRRDDGTCPLCQGIADSELWDSCRRIEGCR